MFRPSSLPKPKLWVGAGIIAAFAVLVSLTVAPFDRLLGRGGEIASGRAASARPPPAPVAPAAVAAVDALAAEMPGVQLAVAVFDRQRGEYIPGRGATTPMYSASLVKMIVGVDVLQRQRAGGPSLGPREIDLVRRALGPSDDQAMHQLWSRFDGMGAVQRVSRQLRLTATRPPADASQWAETTVSAADMVTLYRHVLTRMPATERDLLISSMRAAPPVAADGFDQRFGLLGAGDRATVIAKQGWMCCQNGRITLHSAGLLGADGRYVVALLSSQPSHVGWDGARDNLTSAASALRRILG